jgi:hypothetical protein
MNTRQIDRITLIGMIREEAFIRSRGEAFLTYARWALIEAMRDVLDDLGGMARRW